MSKQACIARVNECVEIARQHFGKPIKDIRTTFNARLTSTAGRYKYSRMGHITPYIELSSKIQQLNSQEFLDDTPGHEAAHYIVHVIYGNVDAHGAEWKSVMRLLGQEPKRCHNMDTGKVVFNYIVNGNTVGANKNQHAKIQSGRHMRCKFGPIQASMWEGSNTPITHAPRPIATPKVKAKPKAYANQGKPSKADIVRQMLRTVDKSAYTMDKFLATKDLVAQVAVAANLKPALCKTYIRNNWSA